MSQSTPRRRYARPLLVAGAALAVTIAGAGCPNGGPFGNLMPFHCDSGQCGVPEDMSAVPGDGPFGNLKAPFDMTPESD
jgi:hypothetical protein